MSIVSSMKDALWGTEYPPSAFHFKVLLSCSLGLADTSFQEVSGIGSKLETTSIPEGGLNDSVHNVPKSISHDNLLLKRGLAPITSPLVLWCQSVFELEFRVPIIPLPLIVMLMNGDRVPVRVWMFRGAYPCSWKVDAFNSTKNEVAIETIELRHKGVYRVI